MIKFCLITLMLRSVISDTLEDTDAFIDKLPENERQELFERISRRITDEIKPSNVSQAKDVELPDAALDVHSEYVKTLVKEETDNINARRTGAANKTDEKIDTAGGDNFVDLTLRSNNDMSENYRRNRRAEEVDSLKAGGTVGTSESYVSVSVIYENPAANARKAGVLSDITTAASEVTVTESSLIPPNSSEPIVANARRSGAIETVTISNTNDLAVSAPKPNNVDQVNANKQNDDVRRTEVFEVDANDPNVFGQLAPVKKQTSEAILNREQPHIIPEHNYNPTNAFYNPHNVLGPNEKDFKEGLRYRDSHLFPSENNNNPVFAVVHNYDPNKAYFNPQNNLGPNPDYQHSYEVYQRDKYQGEDFGVLTPTDDHVLSKENPLYRDPNLERQNRVIDDYADLDNLFGRPTQRPASLPFTLAVPVVRTAEEGEIHDIGLDYYYYGEKRDENLDDPVIQYSKEELSNEGDQLAKVPTPMEHVLSPANEIPLRHGQYDSQIFNWQPLIHNNQNNPYIFKTRRTLPPLGYNNPYTTEAFNYKPSNVMTFAPAIKPRIDSVEPHLVVLGDMIRSQNLALKTYGWLKSTVDIQVSLERLIALSYVENMHPYDMSILKYTREIYNAVRTPSPTQYPPFLAGQSRRLKFPRRQKNKKKMQNKKMNKLPPTGLQKLKKMVNNPVAMMKHFHDNLGIRNERTQMTAQKDFRDLLLEIRDRLHELHSVIKYVASVTDFRHQRWFDDIKDLYLDRLDRKELLTLLLHLASAKFFDLVDNSAKTYGTELQMDYIPYLKGHVEDVERTKDELRFVLKILEALKSV